MTTSRDPTGEYPWHISTVIEHRGCIVRADYQGGPYIDLTFGHKEYQPTEVINVWDYEADKPEIECVQSAVRETVHNWIVIQDAEWPGWYQGYLDNASY